MEPTRQSFLKALQISAVIAGALCSVDSHAIVAVVDQLSITRNGANFFSDAFDDGLEPPLGPGGATSYGVNGTIAPTAESGGRLLLDSSTGIA